MSVHVVNFVKNPRRTDDQMQIKQKPVQSIRLQYAVAETNDGQSFRYQSLNTMTTFSPDNDEDPFAVFGEVDDEDEDKEDNPNQFPSIHVGQSQQLNAKNINNSFTKKDDQVTTKYEVVSSDSKVSTSTEQTEEHICNRNEITIPWKHKPLYIGPIMFVSLLEQFGGGRGCVARHNLQPGTLILIEEPIFLWSSENDTNCLTLSTISSIFDQLNANEIVHSIEFFYPTRAIVNQYCRNETTKQGNNCLERNIQEQVVDMMNYIERTLMDTDNDKDDASSNIKYFVAMAANKQIQNSDGSSIDKVDIIRIMLALRYNGLESGIYLYSAMLNHSDQPNCVKFLPEKQSLDHVATNSSRNTDDHPKLLYSEIRCTRFIQQGEPLTISYIPKILCHASRRKYLWDQHRFDIGSQILDDTNRNRILQSMELVNGQFPFSNCSEFAVNSVMYRIETTITEFTEMYEELKCAITTVTPDNAHKLTVIEQIKALELSTLELCTEAKSQLSNDNHILLVPCLKLHLDVAYLIIQEEIIQAATYRMQLFGRMIVTLQHLIPLQIMYHGHDHYDVARSYLDLSQTIEILLSKSSKTLLSLYENKLNTISAWTKLEYEAKKEYVRIHKLYPRDASMYFVV